MSSGQDEAIAVDPPGIFGKITKRMSEEDRSDLSRSKRQTKMTGSCRLNSVHSQAACLSGGLRENFCIYWHWDFPLMNDLLVGAKQRLDELTSKKREIQRSFYWSEISYERK